MRREIGGAEMLEAGMGGRQEILYAARPNRARKGARGAAPEPRQGDKPPETPAPFPFRAMFQNGPRRQGCAPENLFKTGKDFPPPRRNRAPLTAAGRSEDLTGTRERGPMQRQNHPSLRLYSASRWSAPQSTLNGKPDISIANKTGHLDKLTTPLTYATCHSSCVGHLVGVL